MLTVQAHVGIIERWGKFDRVAQPGFNCVCCCLGETKAGEISALSCLADGWHVRSMDGGNDRVQLVARRGGRGCKHSSNLLMVTCMFVGRRRAVTEGSAACRHGRH